MENNKRIGVSDICASALLNAVRRLAGLLPAAAKLGPRQSMMGLDSK